MRIVIDGRWIKQTGIGRYLQKTLSCLLELDKKNTYLLLVRSCDLPDIKLRAKNLELIKADYPWYGLAEQSKFLNLINSLKPDLVHFTNFNMPLMYKGKFVVTIHDLTLLNFKNINKQKILPSLYYVKDLAMRKVLKKAASDSFAIFTPTKFIKKQIVQKYKLDSSKVIVTPEATEPKVRITKTADLGSMGINRPFILYVGNAYPHKNLERLILAYGKLITDYLLDYQLVIVGKKDSFRDQIEQDVNKAKLNDKVIFTGFVGDAILHYLYKSAEIYVFPSLSEGFGLPGLEAMSYDLPVVSSDATCLPEVFGDAALYFDPRNIDDMARKMAELISDDKLKSKLVRLGRARIKIFSWDITAKKTLNIYKKAFKD
jgi:glycosyltransferase involved in cell wall biosynthesis